MDYNWHYNRLIETRKNRELVDGQYYERHHILMKSMGGSDNKTNLVHLTAREHFLAHWLLWRIYRNRPTATAFILMSRESNSSRSYEEARESISLTKISTETRKRMSDFAKTKTGEKNSFFGKKHSEFQKKIWSINRTGKPSPHRKKIIQFSLDSGEEILTHASLQAASEYSGICIASVLFSCNNPTKKVRKGRNFSFKYTQ